LDSVRLARGRTDAGELWAFVHDTTPPRIRAVTVGDSVSATLELSQPIDPRVRLDPKSVMVGLLPDSTPVPVVSLLPKPVDDSLHGAAAAAPDSLKADSLRADSLGPDTTAAPPPGRGGRPRLRAAENQPLTSRPALTDRLVVRVGRPWTPGAKYAITLRALRNVSGVTGDAVGTLAVPERQAADSAAADSLRTAPDSQAAKPGAKPSRGTPKPPAKVRKPLPSAPSRP
jgi:hypothetical protein